MYAPRLQSARHCSKWAKRLVRCTLHRREIEKKPFLVVAHYDSEFVWLLPFKTAAAAAAAQMLCV